jgi:thiosulfate/3-mercaptopyruvate sulfurtransferase
VNDLVSTAWLGERLGLPDLVVLDATYMLPGSGRDAQAEFRQAHVPGAVFFDIDAIADAGIPLPHMMPSAEQFARQVGALGVGDDTDVVVYDAHGLMSAARAWWMLRAFGHARVAVLDGGLPKWIAEGRPVATGDASAPSARTFFARPVPGAVALLDDVAAASRTGAAQILDARAAERFTGEAEEIRPGLRRGHVPGSRNLPFTALLDPRDKTLLPVEEIARRIAAAGIDKDRPVITTCGSGVTACVLALGLRLAGASGVAVYDGSWTEWGQPSDRPVETGPAR